MAAVRRNAIVTGSAGALGHALAVRLAHQGWRIALVDLDAERNQATAAAVTAAGGEARCETFDVTDRIAWQSLHDRLRGEWSQLDLLANNAGVAGAGEVGQFPLADWDWMLDVNLKSVVYGCHTFVAWLKQNPAGAHVLNTSSFASFAAFPSMAAYAVAKAGVTALSETLRTELATTCVGVTVLCPGFFASNLLERGRLQTDEQRAFAAESMRQAAISADDVAAAALEAVRKKQFYVLLPRQIRKYWWIKRLAPAYFLRRVARRYWEEKPKFV
jgi:NADP-dependent 3-hydroxy acid dehydrogenase YdfG